MNRITRLWDGLFEPRRAVGYELLLLAVLLKAVRDAVHYLTMSAEEFQQIDPFLPQTLKVVPTGWVAWMPVDLALSQALQRGLALVLLVAAVLWLLKRSFVIAPLVCTICFGLLQSLHLSHMFNYKHQHLITTWVMIVFAVVYILRQANFRIALRERRFWNEAVYPAWAAVLIISFLGFQYTYSGIEKLRQGGLQAGSGVKLQLLVHKGNASFDQLTRTSPAARLILEHRWMATAAMTASVIFETGAVVAFFIGWLRPWWALGLAGMHVAVILSMHIPFLPNTLVLCWLAVPFAWWSLAFDAVRSRLFSTARPVVSTS